MNNGTDPGDSHAINMPEATPLRLLEDVKKGPGFDRT
jgi:hypothetical protein